MGFRIAGAPIEDLLFGFAMVVGFIAYWEFRKKRTNLP
jgi:hypothetical protein